MKHLLWAIVIGAACDEAPTTNAPDDSRPLDTDDVITESDDSLASATSVTVGAYMLQGDVYVDRDADLTYEIGADCQVWSRTANHPDRPMPGHPDTPHDHWNAADDSTYIDDAFTWTEYGPYVTEDEIIAACAAGDDPSDPKTVTSSDYTEFQPGLFLKIKSVQ